MVTHVMLRANGRPFVQSLKESDDSACHGMAKGVGDLECDGTKARDDWDRLTGLALRVELRCLGNGLPLCRGGEVARSSSPARSARVSVTSRDRQSIASRRTMRMRFQSRLACFIGAPRSATWRTRIPFHCTTANARANNGRSEIARPKWGQAKGCVKTGLQSASEHFVPCARMRVCTGTLNLGEKVEEGVDTLA